jgi:hypothetical protein
MAISLDAIGATPMSTAGSPYAWDAPRPIQSKEVDQGVDGSSLEGAVAQEISGAIGDMAVALTKQVLNFGFQELQRLTSASEATLKELNEEEG